MDEIENTSSGATESGSTPAPEESASPAPTQTEAQSNESTATQTQDASTPFHEHPRFKEVIEQKNTFAKQLQETQQYMQQMQTQYEQRMQQMMQEMQALKPAPQKPYQALLDGIREASPEFAKLLEQQMSIAEKVPQLEQKLTQYERKEQTSVAQRQMNTLLDDLKIAPELRPRYEREIKAAAYEDPNASLQDLPRIVKQVHDDLGKFFDTYNRQIRTSYVTEKKKDATPAPQTGGAAVKQAPKPMAREDFIKWAAQELRKET